jgi:hypothetical protein
MRAVFVTRSVSSSVTGTDLNLINKISTMLFSPGASMTF